MSWKEAEEVTENSLRIVTENSLRISKTSKKSEKSGE